MSLDSCNVSYVRALYLQSMLTIDEEKALVEACRSDPTRFERLYEEYHTPIFGYVFRRVGDYDRARDITSETFLKAFNAIHRFRWKDVPFSSWLYRIATNEVNSFYRRRRYPVLEFLDLRSDGVIEYPDPASLESEKREIEHELEKLEKFRRVQQVLQVLPIKYQVVVSLRFFEEKSIREIAEILGKKEGTIKSLLSRGLERIRASL